MWVWISLVIILVSWVPCVAQNSLTPIGLSISSEKTTNLIFPFSIKSVDRGSKDLLVQKAKNVENVLQVKAASCDFGESNLTVITADGNLFSFLLVYDERPSILNLRLTSDDGSAPLVQFSDFGDNESKIAKVSEWIAARKPSIRGKKERKFDILMALEGVYIDNDLLFFKIRLENNSQLNYDVDQLRFYIRDKKQSKRTAFQEVELKPVKIHGDAQRIRGESSHSVVLSFPKFTIPDKKIMVVQLLEKNGGRNLEIQVKYKTIAEARSVKY